MQKLFLIDANSLIHRTFHALPALTSPKGEPTGSLYGLASILISLLKENPDFCAALFDRPEPTFRKQEFEFYKAQRPKAPDELIFQIKEAHNLFLNFGIQFFEKPGFEADDLIASFVNKFEKEPDLQIIILTGDRDAFQLIKDDKIIVRILKKGISEIEDYNENLVYEKFGVLPSQIIDFKALIGDVSDNIRGILGIGPKTAKNLIEKYGSIEEIYKNLNELPKIKNILEENKDNLLLAQKLITLKKDIEIDINLSDLKINQDKEKLINYFQKFGFNSLIKRLENQNNYMDIKNNNNSTKKISKKQISLF